jgi:hypothetical protein
MKRDEILDQAGNLIKGDRAQDYGDAYLNHMRIAEFWNNYLDHTVKIAPTDVAVMMMLVKVARLMNEYKNDSFVDICGYAALAGEMSVVDGNAAGPVDASLRLQTVKD